MAKALVAISHDVIVRWSDLNYQVEVTNKPWFGSNPDDHKMTAGSSTLSVF